MTRRQIETFFRTLSREFDGRATVFLTGAAAAAVWGRVRPSVDVDFGITLRARGDPARWAGVHRAVERTTRLTGIAASYTEDIGGWGQITLLDYRRKARGWRRFGRLEVRLLDPAHWSIGKMTRYLDPDVEDMARVFRLRRVRHRRLVTIWGRALRASPPSTVQFQFRRQVEAFLRQRGAAIWGRSFDAEAAVRRFHRAAKVIASG